MLSGQSLGDDGQAYQERTLLAELHVRTPLNGGILLSHRLRSEARWLGENAESSARLRYRLLGEKEITHGNFSFVPYASVGPYYDSRFQTVNRIRLIPGASVAWSPHYAIEGNVTYQYDSHSSTRHLYAFNLILHLFFETRKK